MDRIFELDRFLEHLTELTGIEGFREKIKMDKIATLK